MSVDVSVIVPLYNHEVYIGRCLRSLIDQICLDFTYEIIVIDDNSQDKSVFIVEQFIDSNSRLKLVKNTSNRGLPTSLNRGLATACGRHFVRVDSDDFVNKYFLSFLHVGLDQKKEWDAVACDYLIVDEQEKVVACNDAQSDPIACGILFNRAEVMDLGGYNEAFLRNEDKELRCRFDKTYKVGHLPIPLYRYRRHGTNITNDEEQMALYERRLKNLNHLTK